MSFKKRYNVLIGFVLDVSAAVVSAVLFFYFLLFLVVVVFVAVSEFNDFAGF